MKSKILFGLTGSIACYKACAAISKLVQKGYSVQTVATESALKFVGEATLEGLTGLTVAKSLWDSGRAMEHIHLIRDADLVVIAPATANFINSTAQGLGNDLLSTLALAHDFKKPFLIAPAMNHAMLNHPATQSSLKRLGLMGFRLLDSNQGSLACGESGSGRMLEPEQLIRSIETLLPSRRDPLDADGNPTYLKILVTAGGTQVPVDSVRSITNSSTGRTGTRIAHHLRLKGHEVCLLLSENGDSQDFLGRVERFSSVSDLESRMKNELGQRNYDLLIHSAAVSDFFVQEILAGDGKPNRTGDKPSGTSKLKSEGDLLIRLVPGPKLIQHAQSWSRNPNLNVVGFKLTSYASSYEQAEAINKVFYNPGVIAVVHNDKKEIDSGNHLFHLWLSPESEKASYSKIEDLIDHLMLGAKLLKGGPNDTRS